MDGQAFVTPHAIRQFQARIAPLDWDAARGAILAGLEAWTAVRPSPTGNAIVVRVRGLWSFRVVVSRGEGDLPAVVTILRSGK